MQFTLSQLTPENLKLLFESAMYSVTDTTPHTLDADGDIEKYGGLSVIEDNLKWFIQPSNDNDHIKFFYQFWTAKEEGDVEEIMLKMSNYYDRFPVHCRFEGFDKDGDPTWSFINSAIFPSDEAVEGKHIIKIFRTFQKFVRSNMRMFDQIKQIAKDE